MIKSSSSVIRFLIRRIGLLTCGLASAQVPIVSTWPGGSADWNVPGIWLHLPTPGLDAFNPPNNNGNYIYNVLIPTGTVNQSLFATVTDITIGPTGTLQIAAGEIDSLIFTVNNGTLRLTGVGRLATAELTNNIDLEINTGGILIAGDIQNPGTIDAEGLAFITAGNLFNHVSGVIDIGNGPLDLNAGLITNDGDIDLETPGAILTNATGFAFTGGGDIHIKDLNASITTASVISNSGSHRIRGKGLIAANLIDNSALILADALGDTLDVEVIGTLTNSGRLSADSGGVLDIEASALTNTGTVEAINASRLDVGLSGGALGNGNLITATTGGSVNIDDSVIGNSVGRIESRSGGIVSLIDSHTTGGAIDADASTRTLLIGPNQITDVTIVGLLETQPGGSTQFLGTNENTLGDIRALTSAQLWSANTTINGGIISGNGQYDVTSGQTNFNGVGQTWNDITINIHPRARLKLTGDIENNGVLRLVDTNPVVVDLQGHANALVRIDGTVNFTGTGEVRFATPFYNEFEVDDPATSLLTLGSGQTVSTEGPTSVGLLTLNLENAGRVDATEGRIVINNTSTINTGVLAASSGGRLEVVNVAGTVTNNGGTLLAEAASSIDLRGTLIGGTVDGPGTVVISNPTTLTGHVTTTPAADVAVATYGDLDLLGDHTNDGVIRIADSGLAGGAGHDAEIRIDGPVTLDGSGKLSFWNPNENYLESAPGGGTLTIGSDQSLVVEPGARGIINNLPIIIDGTFDSEGIAEVDGGSITNRGIMKARTAGEAFRLGASFTFTPVDNSLGQIVIDAGSWINALNTTITGGSIEGPGTLQISNPVAFDGHVTTGPDANIAVPTYGALTLLGNHTNNGVIRIVDSSLGGGVGHDSEVVIDGPVTLDGTGKVTFWNPHENYLKVAGGGGTLTIGPNQSLVAEPGARGIVNTVPIVNQGTMASEGIIEVYGGTIVNDGTIRAKGSRAFWFGIFGTTAIDNTGGEIVIDPGASIDAGNCVITGGTIRGGGVFSVGNPVVLEGNPMVEDVHISMGGTDVLRLHDTITTNNTISMAGAGTHSQKAQMLIHDAVTLAGPGELRIVTSQENFILRGNASSSDHLTLTEPFDLVITTGSRLYSEVSFTARGRIELNGLTQFFGAAPALTTSPTTVITGTGPVQVTNSALSNAGMISPGNSTGTFSISATITNQGTAVHLFEIGGRDRGLTYDVLSASGHLAAGELRVVLVNGFEPIDGDSFDLFDGSVSGTFATVNLPLLPTGLDWDTTDLYPTGELHVVPDPNAISYNEWLALQTGIPGGLTAPIDDPNGDGVPNVLAFYLGLTAMENALSSLPEMVIQNGNACLTFTRAGNASGISCTVETSLDGLDWQNGPPLALVSTNGFLETVAADLGPTVGALMTRIRINLVDPG